MNKNSFRCIVSSIISIFLLTGCSVQTSSNEPSLFEQWEARNFEKEKYLYIPLTIPEVISGYTISTTYTSQMKNTVLFKNPLAYGGYVFEFIGKEKENASLHITVHSGEVEVKIQSLKIGEASLNDVFDVKEGETKDFQLREYSATNPPNDEVQLLIISSLSEYAIIDYQIKI